MEQAAPKFIILSRNDRGEVAPGRSPPASVSAGREIDLFRGSEETRSAYAALEQAILKQAPRPSAGGSVTAEPGYQELAALAAATGADKGVGEASNCPAYELYLSGLRARPINLLEIGIDTGGSLRMWRDYFPHGQVYGIDIEDRLEHAGHRIHVARGSQDDVGFLQTVAREIKELDVIVDDGSHVSAHVILSFETLFPHLRKGGIYIVEDVGTSYWPHYGGSRGPDDAWTTMNYFKRAADWVQLPFADLETPDAVLSHLAFVHFWPNFIVIRKR